MDADDEVRHIDVRLNEALIKSWVAVYIPDVEISILPFERVGKRFGIATPHNAACNFGVSPIQIEICETISNYDFLGMLSGSEFGSYFSEHDEDLSFFSRNISLLGVFAQPPKM